jgi:glyoxylase-like metal-dependent hydrolase (beta-lactamase superfamily II)
MKRLFLIALACMVSVYVTSQKLVFTPITDSTFEYTTYSTYQNKVVGANGVFKITTQGTVLIDTPWDTTQFQPLLDSIQNRFHSQVVLVIATHAHDDRIAGLSYYQSKGIATFSAFSTYLLCQEQKFPTAMHYFISDTIFRIGNTMIETYYPGAGHTSDNQLIYFPSDRILVGGCFIKSQFAQDLGNLTDANLGMWGVALRTTKKKFKKAKKVIPGHDKGTSKKAIQHSIKLMKQFKHG